MSLTREEWEQMWQALKRIEQRLEHIKMNPPTRTGMSLDVLEIKELIQSVIGQME